MLTPISGYCPPGAYGTPVHWQINVVCDSDSAPLESISTFKGYGRLHMRKYCSGMSARWHESVLTVICSVDRHESPKCGTAGMATPGASQGQLSLHAGSEAHFSGLCSCELKGVDAKKFKTSIGQH